MSPTRGASQTGDAPPARRVPVGSDMASLHTDKSLLFTVTQHAASKTSLWQAYPLISLPLQTTACPSLCHCAPFTVTPRARMSLEDEHYIRVLGAIYGNGYGSLPRCRGLGTAVKLVFQQTNEHNVLGD